MPPGPEGVGRFLHKTEEKGKNRNQKGKNCNGLFSDNVLQ